MDAKLYLLTLSFLTFMFLAFFIFSKKKIQKIWPMLLGISPLIMIYALNSNLRIYSFHGFMHTGVVYQLLNGNIPPFNPVLGGQVMHYPWGWHCLAAFFTQLLTITPFYSFALINIVLLFFSMVLIYKISRLLIEDERANIFSVIVSLFAISPMDLYLNFRLIRLLHIKLPLEIRGVPAFDKFSNINGVPVGLVFFLLFLYSIIKLFQQKRVGSNGVLFFISVVGCGFFYPVMLPVIAASTVLVCSASVVINKDRYLAYDLKKIIIVVGLGLTAMVMLMPYFFSITAGMKTSIQFFDPNNASANILRYLVVTVPILLIIYINRNFLKDKLNRTVIFILLSVIVASFSCYIFISLPLESEYKYFMLSTVTLGILGGTAFYAMNHGFKKIVVFILLLLFLAPLYRNARWKSRFMNNVTDVSSLYAEKGRYLYSRNSEENELYQWVRNHTDKNSIFIDSELTIPVLAQRQLFIGMDRESTSKPLPAAMKGTNGSPGYGFTIDTFLRRVYGYDSALIDKRRAIVKSIYNPNQKLTDSEVETLFNAYENTYIVVRTKALEDKFRQGKLNQVFRSSKGHFILYQKES
ncbi:MAG: hypothetical protein JRJ00_05290 [Deltaproteobacteria bacterium]|nr:hypothetical protein [Deltaproteobacteria bacterium]